jgi:hypothetical protein
MPEEKTIEKAKEDLQEGKSPSTAAGEFVHEEIEHVREGKHGARSPQQAIAIGLSKARRAGIPLKPPKNQSPAVQRKAEQDYERGQSGTGRPGGGASRKTSAKRSQARERALEREPKSTASHSALANQARSAAKKRGSKSRHAAAEKAVRTKGKAELHQAAKKAAKTRASKSRSGGSASRKSGSTSGSRGSRRKASGGSRSRSR